MHNLGFLMTRLISALSREDLSLGFRTRSDKNRAVQLQKMDRRMKFRIKEEEELYHLCNENKAADLAYAKSRFSHDADHLLPKQH